MSFDLRLGDCLDPVTGLVSLGDKSVDVAIVDPPYSEHVHSRSRRGHTGFSEGQSSRRATFNRSQDLGFESITQAEMEALADQYARLVRRWVLVFCDIESSHLWRGAMVSTGGLEYIRTGVWIKIGCTPQFTGDRPATGCEAIVIAHPKGRKRWNGGGSHAVWSEPIVLNRGVPGETRVHTTQKPLRLMEDLVELFSEPGELILDSHAGSGTTGAAAIQRGRSFVGWERDPEWFETAKQRLADGGVLPPGFHDERQGNLIGTGSGRKPA